MKPERHIWDEDSTHRAVAGKEYDEVWDYAEQLEARILDEVKDGQAERSRCLELKAENEALREVIQLELGMETPDIDALLKGEDDGN